MATIQEVFNNREIAISIWAIVVLAIVLMSKSLRPALIQFINTAVHILFCRKMVIFSFIFIAFLLCALDLLKWTTFWDSSMVKDTVLWVVFVELPLFGKAIEKAKDYRFFTIWLLIISNSSRCLSFLLGSGLLTYGSNLSRYQLLHSFHLYALWRRERKNISPLRPSSTYYSRYGV